MNIWVLIVGMGAITFFLRFALIGLGARVRFSPRVERLMDLVPTAALAAIITPEIFVPSGELNLSFMNVRIGAAGAAFLAAVYTKNSLLTILLGMLLIWILV